MAGLDWGALRCFSSTGEASAPEEYLWLSALAGYKPVIEYCGGEGYCGVGEGAQAQVLGSGCSAHAATPSAKPQPPTQPRLLRRPRGSACIAQAPGLSMHSAGPRTQHTQRRPQGPQHAQRPGLSPLPPPFVPCPLAT